MSDTFTLAPNTIVYTTINHVSKDGMTRHISLFIVKDGEIEEISYRAALAMGAKRSKKYDGIKVHGVGMDMAYSLVYRLSHSLFPDGFTCTGDNKCKSNDHSNGAPREKGMHHSSGGYALIHRTL